jgi:hypothetical protein
MAGLKNHTVTQAFEQPVKSIMESAQRQHGTRYEGENPRKQASPTKNRPGDHEQKQCSPGGFHFSMNATAVQNGEGKRHRQERETYQSRKGNPKHFHRRFSDPEQVDHTRPTCQSGNDSCALGR